MLHHYQYSTVVLGTVLTILVFSSPTCLSANIYVSTPQPDGKPNNDCLHTTLNKPCNDLHTSLKLLEHMSESTVMIFPGTYNLPQYSSYTFNKLTDIGIMKAMDQQDNASSDPVVIQCTNNNDVTDQSDTGLGFINVTGIQISGVSFYGCGAIRNSTSRNYNAKGKLSLVPVMATLYFENCENVNLMSISIHQSVGVAVQMFSTNGSVDIVDSKFTDSVPDKEGFWGGGVYIEFPYCRPGDNSCETRSESLVDISSVSNARYTIQNCLFCNNTANDTDIDHVVLEYESYHKTMGRGGGMSIVFKGNSANNIFNITGCTFDNNHANHGGGLYLEMQDWSKDNSIYLSNSHFKNNYGEFNGGGLLASYVCMGPDTQMVKITNQISLHNVTFDGNWVGDGGKGGGVSFVTLRQPNNLIKNKFSISDSVFCGNTAFLGSAIRISSYSIVPNGYLDPVQISNVQIMNNVVKYSSSLSRPLGSGALYVSNVPLALSGSITFDDNIGTALAAYHSNIEVTNHTTLTFNNNTGYNGGALSLRSTSIFKLEESVSLDFTGNEAFNKGGAIYADYLDPNIDIETQGCFIQYYDIYMEPDKWNISVTFRNNTNQDDVPNSIHASTLHPCILGQPFGVVKNESELLLNVFCWNKQSLIWDYGDEECNSHITSDLRSFQYSSTPLPVIPGKPAIMNLTGLDDQGNDVTSDIIVRAHSPNKISGVDVDSAYSYISNDQIKLKNKNNASSALIHLGTVGQQLEVLAVLNVTFQKCPPGLSLDESSGVCSCNGTYGGVLKCDSANLSASLLNGYWIGEQSQCKGVEDQLVVSHCKYCDYDELSSGTSGYYDLGDDWETLERKLCKGNKHGHMCSLCDEGYQPAINVHDFECVECRSIAVGVVLFIVCNIVCPLIFIVAIFILDVPLTNGLLHGPIFFAQMVTTVISLDAEDVIQYKEVSHGFHQVFEQVYTTVYGIFNLDFFMIFTNKCIGFNRFSHIVCLQFVVALVPMTFVVLCWSIIVCFNHRRSQIFTADVKGWFQKRFDNIANLMATCMLLSYTKLTVIACYLLTPISLVSSDSEFGDYSHSVLYIDGSICYGSRQMLLYFILVLVVGVVYLIPTPIVAMVFRYNTRKGSRSGFFDKLLKQFQQHFRSRKGGEDFDDSLELQESHNIHKESTYCDPCTCCGKETIIQNRTEYTCECCTANNICKYYQMKPQHCGCAFITSFSLYDLRWLSGFMFILRIIMVLPYVLAWTSVIRYSLQMCICMFAGMAILIIKPYKRQQYRYVDCNRVEAFFFFSLAFLLSLCIYQYNYSTTAGLHLSIWVYVIQLLIVTIPFVWIVCVYSVLLIDQYKDSKVFVKLKQCLTMCCSMPDRVGSERNGHGQYRPVVDDDDGVRVVDVEPSSYDPSVNSSRIMGGSSGRRHDSSRLHPVAN